MDTTRLFIPVNLLDDSSLQKEPTATLSLYILAC